MMQITEKAIKDIEDILDYIAFENHQPINALKIEKDIFLQLKKLVKIRLSLDNVLIILPKQKYIGKLFATNGLLFTK